MTPDVQNFLPKKPMFRFDCKCGQKPRKCFIQVTNRIEFVLKKLILFSLYGFFSSFHFVLLTFSTMKSIIFMRLKQSRLKMIAVVTALSLQYCQQPPKRRADKGMNNQSKLQDF